MGRRFGRELRERRRQQRAALGPYRDAKKCEPPRLLLRFIAWEIQRDRLVFSQHRNAWQVAVRRGIARDENRGRIEAEEMREAALLRDRFRGGAPFAVRPAEEAWDREAVLGELAP